MAFFAMKNKIFSDSAVHKPFEHLVVTGSILCVFLPFIWKKIQKYLKTYLKIQWQTLGSSQPMVYSEVCHTLFFKIWKIFKNLHLHTLFKCHETWQWCSIPHWSLLNLVSDLPDIFDDVSFSSFFPTIFYLSFVACFLAQTSPLFYPPYQPFPRHTDTPLN